MAQPTIDPREKEMAELRSRYAKLRGQKTEEPKKEATKEKTPATPSQLTKSVKKTNPYVQLIKNDINNFIEKIKRLMGLKSKKSVFEEMVEQNDKRHLNISWLEKNKRRFFK